jgi:hypothetical protein
MPVLNPAAALKEFLDQKRRRMTEYQPSPTAPSNFPTLRAKADTTPTSTAGGTMAKFSKRLGRPRNSGKMKGMMKGEENMAGSS